MHMFRHDHGRMQPKLDSVSIQAPLQDCGPAEIRKRFSRSLPESNEDSGIRFLKMRQPPSISIIADTKHGYVARTFLSASWLQDLRVKFVKVT